MFSSQKGDQKRIEPKQTQAACTIKTLTELEKDQSVWNVVYSAFQSEPISRVSLKSTQQRQI